MNLIRIISVIFILLAATRSLAEPWVNTEQLWLRADIEYLADKGIIKAPITTYPLMWGPIVKDLDRTDLSKLTGYDREVYWRVKKASRMALRSEHKRQLKLSAANSEQVLRSFGDSSRGEAEIRAEDAYLNKHWAYKLSVTQVNQPFDDNETRLDGSYVATVWGNWVFAAGYLDHWWGPSWDSANLLSNNARPIPQVMLQRNYSDGFEHPWLQWVGPWSFSFFFGELDDDRVVENAKLWGMSVTFKPLDSLEIGARRTGQWGGEGRPNSLSNFWQMISFGNDNCFSIQTECRENEPGNQLAGWDVRYRLNSTIVSSIYSSIYGEDEIDGLAPSGRFWQLGINGNFQMLDAHWRYFIETSNTFEHDGTDRTNVTYEHHLYPSGYRYNRLVMGSTYDNDSEVLTLGTFSQLDRMNRVQFKLTYMDLNQDDRSRSLNALHSVNAGAVKATRLYSQWQHDTMDYGTLTLTLDVADKVIDGYGRQSDRYRAAIDWSIVL